MLDNWKVKNITRTRQNSRMTGLLQGNGMQHQVAGDNRQHNQQAAGLNEYCKPLQLRMTYNTNLNI